MKALYAFLMSEPAVENEAPKTALNFPYNVRRGIAAWNWLYLKPGVVKDDEKQAPEWNRGAYLVEGLGHCSACHTPRNGLAAEKTGEFHLTGGSAEGWDAPALTDKTASPLPWTKQDLVDYMKTGFSARHSVAAGPMAPVAHGLSQQSDADLDAIATYLMSYRKADAAPAMPRHSSKRRPPSPSWRSMPKATACTRAPAWPATRQIPRAAASACVPSWR
jgi:mono/diheme cytochrome c family protein